MKKIIAAIDGLKYSESTAQYAAQMAIEANAHLVGVFNEDVDYHSYGIYDLAYESYGTEVDLEKLNDADKITKSDSTNKFKQICGQAHTNYSIHHGRQAAMPQLLRESIYADLLVIEKHETFSRFDQDVPTTFVQDLLVDAECPVLVVPREFQEIEKIILLFDGGPSSVYAIKRFSYLFEALKRMPVEVVSVKHARQDRHLPDNRLMKEFMKRHFPDATYKVLTGSPEAEIVKYLKNKHQNELVVLGAYQRSAVSRWFNISMADTLMVQLKTPLFIAHK